MDSNGFLSLVTSGSQGVIFHSPFKEVMREVRHHILFSRLLPALCFKLLCSIPDCSSFYFTIDTCNIVYGSREKKAGILFKTTDYSSWAMSSSIQFCLPIIPVLIFHVLTFSIDTNLHSFSHDFIPIELSTKNSWVLFEVKCNRRILYSHSNSSMFKQLILYTLLYKYLCLRIKDHMHYSNIFKQLEGNRFQINLYVFKHLWILIESC